MNENKFSGPQHFWNQLSFVLYPIGRYAIPKKKEMKKKKQPTHAKTVSVKIPQWITTQNKKRKRKEEDKYHDNKKKKEKRQQKQNANSTGRSYSAPKPVWELLLVRQLQIILGEKLFGPQARLRITPIAWFEPATSMTSLALVARPRLPLDHLETILNWKISIVERKQLCYFVTRYVSEQSKTPFAEGHLHVMNCK